MSKSNPPTLSVASRSPANTSPPAGICARGIVEAEQQEPVAWMVYTQDGQAFKTDERALWVERAIGRDLTDFQRRAVVLLCRAMCCGPYDFSRTFETADWQYGHGVRFVVEHSFATFDMAGLTHLVIGAHDECIRVEIRPVNFRALAICMWPRQREGDISERHPTIERAIHYYRGTTPTEVA